MIGQLLGGWTVIGQLLGGWTVIGLFVPGLVPVHLADQLLARDVGAEVSKSEEPVVVEQHVHQVLELSLIAGSEEAVSVNNL